MLAERVADAFGLGRPASALEPVAGGSSAGRWRLDTTRGRWLVKSVRAPAEWQRRGMVVSGRLELAAARAGVAMPRPVAPRAEGVGLWGRVGDEEFARVSAWVEVVGPTVVDEELAAWVGATLAAIDRLGLPGDPSAEAAYPVHPAAEWAEWLAMAVDTGVLGRPEADALLAAVRAATWRVEGALAGGPEFRLAHRDVSRANILITGDGPVLIDFDHAGPEVPWWEVVHHVFALAHENGSPKPEIVRAAMVAYLTAGGTPGPASPTAFTGMLAATLTTLAYNLWLATGQRQASTARIATAVGTVHEAGQALKTTLAETDHWAGLLAVLGNAVD